MRRRGLRAPSPALVVSLLALFLALGGTTYAATSLPKNSVGTKQLKKNAVTSPKIKDGAVNVAKINTNGLTVPDALHATSADSATSATNATHATSADSASNAADASKLGGQLPSYYLPASVERGVDPITIAPNTSVTLVTLGQLSFVGVCLDNGGVESDTLYIVSSADHAAYSDETQSPSSAPQLHNADMLASVFYLLADWEALSGVATFTSAVGEALSADGQQVFYNLYMGQNARELIGQKCVYGGSFVVR
jgi:hypothetical protein